MASSPFLEVSRLSLGFETPRGFLPAVEDVSFSLGRGEVLGLVGESGCGKSATALALMRLLPPNARVSGGSLLLSEDGAPRDLLAAPEAEMRALRGSTLSIIFQEPMTALNPVMKVGDQIAEALVAHGRGGWRRARVAALEMLRQVAVPDAGRRMSQYPHQLSGGLRQRVMIAMALAVPVDAGRPALLIADEPTTALDVTIQAQILALLAELRQRFGLTLLLISHDLGVVAQVAEKVAVMYAGRIVEYGPVERIFNAPAHPYTQGLLRAAPSLAARRGARLATIPGTVPDLCALPPGCAFEPRCEFRIPECSQAVPGFVELGSEHQARCIRAKEVQAAEELA